MEISDTSDGLAAIHTGSLSVLKASVQEIPLLNHSFSRSANLEQHDADYCKRKKNKQRKDDYQVKVSVTHRTS